MNIPPTNTAAVVARIRSGRGTPPIFSSSPTPPKTVTVVGVREFRVNSSQTFRQADYRHNCCRLNNCRQDNLSKQTTRFPNNSIEDHGGCATVCACEGERGRERTWSRAEQVLSMEACLENKLRRRCPHELLRLRLININFILTSLLFSNKSQNY